MIRPLMENPAEENRTDRDLQTRAVIPEADRSGPGKCRFPGDHRDLFSCYHTIRNKNSERTEDYEAGNYRTGMHH